MTCLGTNRDHSVVFEIASKYCILDSSVDSDGYSISSKGFLPTVSISSVQRDAASLAGAGRRVVRLTHGFHRSKFLLEFVSTELLKMLSLYKR